MAVKAQWTGRSTGRRSLYFGHRDTCKPVFRGLQGTAHANLFDRRYGDGNIPILEKLAGMFQTLAYGSNYSILFLFVKSHIDTAIFKPERPPKPYSSRIP